MRLYFKTVLDAYIYLLSIRHGSISLPIRFWQHATPISSLALSSVQSLMRVLKYKYIEDWMYEANVQNRAQPGGNQMIQTIAVDPDYRGQGIGSSLLQAIEKQAIQNQRHHIALTCLLDRVPFYEKNGYVNQGIAASAHAGEVWYNMTKLLPSQPQPLG